ncbi:chromosomal replication initiator protein DnaA [Chloroflexi bacterium CFX5]|nr:chromosomal replication initiator protein DnaA [Anaerolineales bacterium]MDL1920398.1 chromosomal replication initiator protein DnaA [Chloroflexi bacterium CFX5]NUQ58942.1 chromosomal replication initiator protein DnaA [Anaerolineales bacterium]
MNAEKAWQTVLAQLQMDMPRASYDTWVRDTRPVGYENGMLTVGVRNAYARDWLDSRLATTVNKLLIDTLNSKVSVKFVVSQAEENASSSPEPTLASIQITPPEPKPRHVTLNPRYTFDTYVVGSGNRLAHAACQAVAEKPARAYNPLFLYGGVGLGKTHLLHAIGNACHASGLNILYVSSEEFTNDLIAAIRTHTTQAFREKYRSADVLLIDDIQFIAGKESTQEEFFHTFNTLHGQDKQIIVSSDRPPKSLVTLEERLRSRFEWGLTADIQAPDLETRLAILRSKAERTGRQVSDEILEGIAERVQSNIRELEGALNRIIAYADLSGVPLTPDLVDVALADLIPSRNDIQPNHVVDLVARKFGLTADKLLGRDRTKEVALPRQIAMYLLREEVKISFPQIGEVLGGRDHSTVMSAYEKIKEQIHADRRLEQDIVSIKQQLYNQSVAA